MRSLATLSGPGDDPDPAAAADPSSRATFPGNEATSGPGSPWLGGQLAGDAIALRAVPDAIGPYRILALLGEGGMGVVYRAQQTGLLRRDVALKIVKRGIDTDRVVDRFERERRVLARLDHPNIARVFDAGATDDGRPYFVMELVPRRSRSRPTATRTASTSTRGWRCSSTSARRSATPTRAASSTATSSRRTCSSRRSTAGRCRR